MRLTKSEKIKEAIRHAAAEFLARESNRTSLITVTDVRLSQKRDEATVLITVLPESVEKNALEFVRRKGGALRAFIGERASLQRLPYISFSLDMGEKNRQKIEALSS